MAMFPFANQISTMPVNEDWAFGGGNRYRPGQDPMKDRRLWAPASFGSMMKSGSYSRNPDGSGWTGTDAINQPMVSGAQQQQPMNGQSAWVRDPTTGEYVLPENANPANWPQANGYKGGRAPNPNAEWIPRTAPPGGAVSADMVRNPNYQNPTEGFESWIGAPRQPFNGATQPTQKSTMMQQFQNPMPQFRDRRISGSFNGGQWMQPTPQGSFNQPQLGGGLMDMIRSAQGQMPGGGRISQSAKFGEVQNPGMDFSRMMRGY